MADATKPKAHLVKTHFENFYADGVVETLIGGVNSRIVFFNVDEGATEDTPEKRRTMFSVTVPTAALLEYVVNLRKAFLEGGDNLQNAMRTVTSKSEELLGALGSPGAPRSLKRPSRKSH